MSTLRNVPGRSRPGVSRWLTDKSFAQPRLTVGLWLLAVLVAIPGVTQIQFETAAGSLLNRSEAPWHFYQESISNFGGDEIVVVALKSQDPYDPEVLRELAAISELIKPLDGVRRVDSLSTMPIIRSLPDLTLVLEPALVAADLHSPEDANRVREVVALDRIAPGSLVSPDGRVFAINIFLENGPALDRTAVMKNIHAAVEGKRVWISGVPVYETEIGPRTQREVLLFVPLTLTLMAALLAVLFRSSYAILLPLGCGAVASHLLLSVMGLIGDPLTIIGMVLPSIILALGCAYVMHLLCAVQGIHNRQEIATRISEVAEPIAISGLTTILGFLAIATVDIDAVRGLGTYGGLGVLFVLTASLSLAPALISLRPTAIHRSPMSTRISGSVPDLLVSSISRWRGTIIAVWVVAVAISGLGLSRLYVETDATRWWPEGHEVRDDYEAIREELSGISPMNVVLRARDGRSMTDPELIARVAELTTHLQALPEVGKAVSVADPLLQMHRGFYDDPTAPLPDNQALIAQYLVLLSSVDHIDDLITPDRSTANILLRVDNNGSQDLLNLAHTIEDWWARSGDADVDATATGIMYEFARSLDAIARGQVQGLALAIGAVGLILFAHFRNPATVAIALLPNLLPLLIMFGGLGLFGIPLDAGTACLGSLALGIAVDDTIHLMLGYRLQRSIQPDAASALTETLRKVLPALLFTTLVIATGFGVIALSQFTLTQNLGWVTALVVLLCLLADITLLPALLVGSPVSKPHPQGDLATLQTSEEDHSSRRFSGRLP